MNNFLKVYSGLNVMPLLLQTFTHRELFAADRIRATYAEDSPHSATTDILLRFSDTEDPDIGDELQAEWLPAIAQLHYARDIAFMLMAQFRGEQLGRVMITSLPPGKTIAPHADLKGRYAGFYTRFHVPLQSDPGVVFSCGEDAVQMQPGEVWWFNGRLTHSVVNNSARERLNLIVDLRQ